MGTQIKKRIVSGGIWAVIAKASSAITTLIINACIARLLIPSDVGIYFLVFSFINVFAVFSLFGLEWTSVKYIAESMALNDYARTQKIIRYTFVLGTGFAIFIACLLLLFQDQVIHSLFKDHIAVYQLGLVIVWILCYVEVRLISELFRGFHKLKHASIFNVAFANALLALMLSISLILFGKEVITINHVISMAAIAYGLNALVGGILLLPIAKDSSWVETDKPITSQPFSNKKFLGTSWTIYLFSIFLLLSTEGYLWILNIHGGNSDADVAIFGAAVRLNVLITSILSMLSQVIASTVSELFTKKEFKKLETLFRGISSAAGILALCILLGLVLFGRWILLIIYGEVYIAAYPALLVLASAAVLKTFIGNSGILLIMSGRHLNYLIIIVLATSIGFSTAWFLAEEMGFLGVAIGVSIGVVLSSISETYYCYRYLDIKTYASKHLPEPILQQVNVWRGKLSLDKRL